LNSEGRNIGAAFKALLARKLWRLPGVAGLLEILGWRRLYVTETSRQDSFYNPTESREQWVAAGLEEWRSTQISRVETFERGLGLWRVFNGSVVFNTKFPAVILGSGLKIQPRFEAGPYSYSPTQSLDSSSGIYLQSGDFVLMRRMQHRRSLTNAIYCGTRAPHNWGHWLLNFLPGVMIAAEYFGKSSAPPLIVPPGYRSTSSRAELFDLIWGDRDVVVCDPKTEIQVGELFWFEQPVADSPRSSQLENLKLKAVNIAAIARFRETILASIPDLLSPSKQNLNVFLAREFGRRDYNQLAVHKEAESHGYQVSYLNRLSIQEQLSLIYRARRIVGPIGSAFANILFASPRAKALTFVRPEHRLDNSWFSSFAHVAGAELSAVYVSGLGANPWALDPGDVAPILKNFAV